MFYQWNTHGGMHGRQRKCNLYSTWGEGGGKPERHRSEDIPTDDKKISAWILKRQDVKAWTGVICNGMDTAEGILFGNEPSGSIRVGSLRLSEEKLASQALKFMGLVG
jgi:hypothetical protein